MANSSPQLDFYVKPKTNRQCVKERLSLQREPMYSWRRNFSATTFHPTTGKRVVQQHGFDATPQQRLGKTGSVAPPAEEPLDAKQPIWSSAEGTKIDRRREWRQTGFTFERTHFKKLSSSAAAATTEGDQQNQQRRTAAANRQLPLLTHQRKQAVDADLYTPYLHDSILLCRLPDAALSPTADGERYSPKKMEVVVAATCNEAERQQREWEAAANPIHGAAGLNSAAATSPTWCDMVGPAIAGKQRTVAMVEGIFSDLLARQATLTGAAYGSPPSRQIQLPTGELGFTVHPSYLATHRSSRAHTASGAGSTNSRSTPAKQRQTCEMPASNSSTAAAATEPPATGSGKSGGSRLWSAESASISAAGSKSTTNPQQRSNFSRASDAYGSTTSEVELRANEVPQNIPAEAKETRIYSIQLRHQFTNAEASTLKRKDPARFGRPVILPPMWVSDTT